MARLLFRRHSRLCVLLDPLEPRELLSATDPSAREQYDFYLINRFRQNPVQELPLLLTTGNSNILSALSVFGVDLNALTSAFSTLTPVPPLAWNSTIYPATLAHDQLMLADDTQSHQLPGEADIGERVAQTGYDWSIVGENIYAYADDILYGQAGFVIDWGTDAGGVQDPPGHRVNLLNAAYRDVAVAVIDSTAGKATGPLLITQDFASQSPYGNPVLTGVVFSDLNNNDSYDVGEGLSGVSVHITGGAINTTVSTLTAGMYQITLPSGTYTLTYTGTFGTRTQSITMSANNAELDLNTSTSLSTATDVRVIAATQAGFTLAATVTSSSGTPAGTVTFFNGTTTIGTGTLVNGTATLVTNSLPLTTDLLIARYNGNSSYRQSTSAIDQVNLADTVAPAVSAIHIADIVSYAATTFTITFVDNVSIDASTLKDMSSILITGPGGYAAHPIYAGIDHNSSGATRTVTYSVPAPGGSWGSTDAGVYGVSIIAGKIRDVSGNAMGGQGLSIFNVAPVPFFDNAWYLARYPDIASAVSSGVVRSGYDHFIRFGQYESRQPSVYYSDAYYLAKYPDVAAAVNAHGFTSGFMHFVFFGQQEGRAANPYFKESIYLALNPDVVPLVHAGGFASGFEHYLLYGAAENRRASAYFDAVYYLAASPDVNAAVNSHAVSSAYAHFMLYGLAEKRPANVYFNQAYYLSHNPDVASAVAGGAFVSAYAQYVLYGQFEHRDPSALYDDYYYLAHNPDVAGAVTAHVFQSGFEHYILYGQYEGRIAHA